MQALAICGSPRAEGNTEFLLRRCLDGLAQHNIAGEFVSLRGKIIRPCMACGLCKQLQDLTCAIDSDDFHLVFQKILDADILIVGSPVYFGSATPEMMALLDRAGYIARACGNPLARKIGGPIAVARRAGQNFTYAQLLMWFMINGLVVPGSTYWNIAIGGAPGSVAQDEEALSTVDAFAENLAWLARKIHADG